MIINLHNIIGTIIQNKNKIGTRSLVCLVNMFEAYTV